MRQLRPETLIHCSTLQDTEAATFQRNPQFASRVLSVMP
jgi:hypothetical protein